MYIKKKGSMLNVHLFIFPINKIIFKNVTKDLNMITNLDNTIVLYTIDYVQDRGARQFLQI